MDSQLCGGVEGGGVGLVERRQAEARVRGEFERTCMTRSTAGVCCGQGLVWEAGRLMKGSTRDGDKLAIGMMLEVT